MKWDGMGILNREWMRMDANDDACRRRDPDGWEGRRMKFYAVEITMP
jgi:hypothetical protein